jgi:Uma2 family endonuclease
MNDNPQSQEPAATVVENGGPLLALSPEDYPDMSGLITEDDTPMDNLYTEKQQRLLTEPLYSSWSGPGEGRPFVAMANVGLFSTLHTPPLVPDTLLGLDIQAPPQLRVKEHRSYFIWMYGHAPDVVVEIVSDRRGGEDTDKLHKYAQLGVGYYVIHDPDNVLGGGVLRVFELHGRRYVPVPNNWLSQVGLGLVLWRGKYEGAEETWLRWCDQAGNVILSGYERAEHAEQRAEHAEQRAAHAEQRAEHEAERARQLEARLRALGIDPSA